MPDHIVELKKRPRDRVKIGLAGGRFFTVPDEAAQSYEIGSAVSDAEISRLDRMDQYFRGRDKALGLLSKRARTRKQIETALDTLSLEPSIRNGLLSELEQSGLVDDARFTREYVKLKAEVRRLGPYRLRHDLQRLGVRRTIVETVLDEVFDDDTQREMAREVALRRAGPGRIDEKAARRLSGFLQRKGFDFEVVNQVVYDLLHRRGPDPAESDTED
jgi:regulatory protein